MWKSIIFIALLVTSSNAMKFRGPRATMVVDFDNHQLPAMKPTAAPQLGKRANNAPTTYYEAPDATCGWINGNADNFYTCGSGQICDLVAGTSSSYQPINCCNSNSCVYRTACINSAQIAASCNSACLKDDLTVKWYVSSMTGRSGRDTHQAWLTPPSSGSNDPFCVTVRWPGVLAQDFYCDTAAIGILMVTTTYSGQVGRSYATYTITPSSSSSSTSSPKAVTATPISSAGSVTSSTSPTPGGLIIGQTSTGSMASSVSSAATSAAGGTSSTSAASSSSAPIGAIVGSVVGGVVALVAILAALWFFWWRKRSTKTTGVDSAPTYNGAGHTSAYNDPSVQKTPMSESHVNNGAWNADAVAPGFATAAAVPQHDPNKGYYAQQYAATQPVYEADGTQLDNGQVAKSDPPVHSSAMSELPGDIRMRNNNGVSPPIDHNRMSQAGTISSSGVPYSPTPSHGIPEMHDPTMVDQRLPRQAPTNIHEMSATSGPIGHELE